MHCDEDASVNPFAEMRRGGRVYGCVPSPRSALNVVSKLKLGKPLPDECMQGNNVRAVDNWPRTHTSSRAARKYILTIRTHTHTHTHTHTYTELYHLAPPSLFAVFCVTDFTSLHLISCLVTRRGFHASSQTTRVLQYHSRMLWMV